MLRPKEETFKYSRISGQLTLGRVHKLEIHFHSLGVLILGIQEGRGKGSDLIQGTYYHMNRSVVAPNGSYGVQLLDSQSPCA